MGSAAVQKRLLGDFGLSEDHTFIPLPNDGGVRGGHLEYLMAVCSGG